MLKFLRIGKCIERNVFENVGIITTTCENKYFLLITVATLFVQGSKNFSSVDTLECNVL